MSQIVYIKQDVTMLHLIKLCKRMNQIHGYIKTRDTSCTRDCYTVNPDKKTPHKHQQVMKKKKNQQS